jgi:hypothetical protein
MPVHFREVILVQRANRRTALVVDAELNQEVVSR